MSRRILIVDDNRDLAESLAALLEIEGYEVDIAYTGSEASVFLSHTEYHYCLTDIKLPDTNGIEIYNFAKHKLPAGRIIPISGFRLEQIMNEVFFSDHTAILNLDINPASLQSALEKNREKSLYLLLAYRNRKCIDHEHLLSYGVTDYHVFTSLPSDNDLEVIPSKDAYIFNLQEPVVITLASVCVLRKHQPDACIIIMIPDIRNVSGNPLQSYDVTGMLFKPFKTDFFLSLLKGNFGDNNTQGTSV